MKQFFLFLLLAQPLSAQDYELKFEEIKDLTVTVEPSDYEGRGHAIYPDKLEIRGDLNYIFKSIESAPFSTRYHVELSQHFLMTLSFESEVREIWDEEAIAIYKWITKRLECDVTTESNPMEIHKLVAGEHLKSEKSMTAQPGVINKIESKNFYWKGWNVSLSKIAEFLSSYYLKSVTSESDGEHRVNITIDKRLSFEENIEALGYKYGISAVTDTVKVSAYSATSCQAPD